MTPEIFYRFEDPYLANDYDFDATYGKLREQHFSLVSETPKGYWIGSFIGGEFLHATYFSGTKWVSATARKRFAYPTRELALESYLARKKRHISILKSQLERAEAGRTSAIKLKKDLT